MKKITLLFLLSSFASFSQTFGVSSYVTGLSNPVEVNNAGDSRLFIVQKSGQIRIAKPNALPATNGTLNAANFLNIPTLVNNVGEMGLLGLAFHPNYATNGYFYVDYVRPGDKSTVIARYTVSSDPDVADPNSAVIMLTVAQPFDNHKGGTLRFGPDGYLYIGMGDGGDGGDPGNRAQNINVNLGKMLRLDVDAPAPYIPASNPYVGVAGNDEIWAIGMRNPWKYSFNRLNGDMWIADVGQEEHEEVNKIAFPQPTGLNFGWRCYEGNTPYNTTGCGAASMYTFPLIEYLQSALGACSVTGGYYYTGSAYPNFANKYIFGDYCLSKIFTLTDAGIMTVSPVIAGLSSITTFGQDINGELYVVGGGTNLYRLVDTSLGLSDFSNNGLSLYPNPATNGEFFIRNSGASQLSQVSLFDLSGKLLLNENLAAMETYTIKTGSLQSGLYIVTVEDFNGKKFSSKLTIE
ncbi:MAG TPA: PQQ-dependent sugar dehydrogenase [Flavobacterium sp.]|nr:PQQ-dependent sugar dehydrogenase [Flavobacterium sp.]